MQSLLIHAACHWLLGKASVLPTEPNASPRTLQVPPLAPASFRIYVYFPTRHRFKSHLGAAILFSETIATVATCLETETSGSCSFSISFPWVPALKGQLSVHIFLSSQEGISYLPTSLAGQSLPNLGSAKTSYVPRNHSLLCHLSVLKEAVSPCMLSFREAGTLLV